MANGINSYFTFSSPKGIAAWTIAIFGFLALFLGAIGLVYPESMIMQLGFEVAPRNSRLATDFTLVFITTSSMASFNMGVYYLLAACSQLKQFFAWTVPFRILTFIIFSTLIITNAAPLKFFAIAGWELAGALATGTALWYENKNK